MKLEHNKTYLNNLDRRVKVKKLCHTLFRCSRGYLYFDNGDIIGKCHSYDLITETDGTIMHFFKRLLNK